MQNAWDTFIMGIADDKIVKELVDALTGLLNAYNKLTEGMNGVFGSAVRLGTVFAGLRLAKWGIEKSAAYFVNLKQSAEAAAAGITKLTAVQKLTQKINNFKMGNGFVTNLDIETGKAHGKLAALKADFKGLKASIMEPVVPTGTIVGFNMLDGKIVGTSIAAEGATESMELGLSEVAAKTIYASAIADGMGDELVESGISSTYAMKVLEEQIEALNKDLALAEWLGDDVGVANI
jgi:hypothetical protein